MVSAIDVAAYILERVGNVTTMKLQKLVYYSQVRHLVTSGTPLFDNRIEAWANGPVVPDLYRLHSGKYMVGPGDLGSSGSADALSEQQRLAAGKAVELFGSYSGERLRELTHSEAPWADAREGYKPGERCEVEISVAALRRYYCSASCSSLIAQ